VRAGRVGAERVGSGVGGEFGESLRRGEHKGAHRVAAELVHPGGTLLAHLAAQRGVDDRAKLGLNRGVRAHAACLPPKQPGRKSGTVRVTPLQMAEELPSQEPA